MKNKSNGIVKLENEPERLKIGEDSKEDIKKENLLNLWLGDFLISRKKITIISNIKSAEGLLIFI